jgi:glycosyltransferase involved in cell wall biosynthesis
MNDLGDKTPGTAAEGAIADALVLLFTQGVSLWDWRKTGLLTREFALYERLAPYYKRIILVSYGRDSDLRIGQELATRLPPTCPLTVLCNTTGLSPSAFPGHFLGRVREELTGCRSVLVKTNQFAAGEIAVDLRKSLRDANLITALIARGGYLWSRFAAYDHGAESALAQGAASCERILCTYADMIVGTTDEMVNDLMWRYHIESDRTSVIPNYVLPDGEVAGASEREPGLILYAGQLNTRKRVDVLIEAIALMADDMKSLVTLEVYGDGPEQGKLKALAEARSVNAKFSSRIPHEQLLQRMSRASIYAQASELEGHPKTVIEAMASGAAVVVADSPGIGNVVENGVTGIRVPSSTPEVFSHAMQALIADAEWRDMLGVTAARVTRQQFGLDRILPMELEAHRRAMTYATHAANQPRVHRDHAA